MTPFDRGSGKIKLDAADLALGYELGKDDLQRTLARLPDEDLRRQIRKSSPKLTDDKITEVMAYIRKEHAADPLALIQPLASCKDGCQLQVMRGVNFELALFLAQLTGAAVYSNQRLTRDDLAAARLPPPEGATTSDRVLPLQVALDVNPEKLDADRTEPSSQAFRASLRALWAVALAHGESSNESAVDAALGSVKDTTATAANVESDTPDALREKGSSNTVFKIDAQLVIPPTGYGLTTVRRFLVTFGRRRHMNAVPLAIVFGPAAAPGTESLSGSQPASRKS
jgi:hypothetical protein